MPKSSFCFHLMLFMCSSFGLLVLYSSKEELRASSCDFWCNILLPQVKVNLIFSFIDSLQSSCFVFSLNPFKYYGSFSMLNQTEKLPIRIEWFPSYCELRSALKTYGFLFNYLSRTESIITSKYSHLFATSLMLTI